MRVLLLGCLIALTGCASVVLPQSVQNLNLVQIHERAGMYPGDWMIRGNAHASQLAALEAWAATQGVVIAVAPITPKRLLGHSAYGTMTGWVVLINDGLSTDNRLYTLLHELAHVYSPKHLTYGAAETIAEMVAAATCQQLGLNVWPETTAYLASHVPLDDQTTTVRRYATVIDELSARFTKAAGKDVR